MCYLLSGMVCRSCRARSPDPQSTSYGGFGEDIHPSTRIMTVATPDLGIGPAIGKALTLGPATVAYPAHLRIDSCGYRTVLS